MSNQNRQREANTSNAAAAPPPAQDDALDAARARVERLFAQAAEEFESRHAGDSREFLERSRQTGGE